METDSRVQWKQTTEINGNRQRSAMQTDNTVQWKQTTEINGNRQQSAMETDNRVQFKSQMFRLEYQSCGFNISEETDSGKHQNVLSVG